MSTQAVRYAARKVATSWLLANRVRAFYLVAVISTVSVVGVVQLIDRPAYTAQAPQVTIKKH